MVILCKYYLHHWVARVYVTLHYPTSPNGGKPSLHLKLTGVMSDPVKARLSPATIRNIRLRATLLLDINAKLSSLVCPVA